MKLKIRVVNISLMMFGALLLTCSKATQNPSNSRPFSTPETDRQVNALLSQMTLEEKLAQIEGIRPHLLMEDGKFSIQKCREVIPNGIGHVCQFSSGLTLKPEALRDLVRQIQHYLITETRLKIPAIFHEEAITGFSARGATTFPQQIGMGCSWNPEQVSANTASTAKLMRAAGATYALSPMMDLSRTPHWGRIEESYGEDAYLTSAMGLAFVRGLQGLSLRTGVAATTKHFAGYGAQTHEPKTFYEDYLRPHEVLIKKGNVKSVMPSYSTFQGEAMAASRMLLTDILRTELGFDGVVVSDYGSINLIFSGHKLAKSRKEAGAMALKAGTDVELAAPICYPLLAKALEDSLVHVEEIDRAVRRLLTMKARLGLLDKNPVIGQDGPLDFDPPENRKLAYESACQSIVLLKNNGVLPLKKEVKKIALVGPNAATVHGLLGDYTYQSMIAFWWGTAFDPEDPKLISLKEGLASRVKSDVVIKHERGCDWSASLESEVKAGLGDDRLSKVKMLAIKGLPQPNLANALKISRESDVIIAAMGENIYLCGEGRERKGIRLPGEQEEFVRKLTATGKPVILILFGGRPQVIRSLENKCAAIVQAWFPGEEGGHALADILTGRVNPSAKLCVTYPATEDTAEVNYRKGYDSENPPLYSFGYGLSYTAYEYGQLSLADPINVTDEKIRVSFVVKNTGQRDGTEIAQLYVSPCDSGSTMDTIQLAGFTRVQLKAGEAKRVCFDVSLEQFAQYLNGDWVIEPAAYSLMAGASCSDIRLRQAVHINGAPRVLEKGRMTFFAECKQTTE